MNSDKVVTNNYWEYREHIAVINKNQILDIMVSHCKKKNKDYIDIRVYRNGVPTRHGVAVGYKTLKKIITALNDAIKRIDG